MPAPQPQSAPAKCSTRVWFPRAYVERTWQSLTNRVLCPRSWSLDSPGKAQLPTPPGPCCVSTKLPEPQTHLLSSLGTGQWHHTAAALGPLSSLPTQVVPRLHQHSRYSCSNKKGLAPNNLSCRPPSHGCIKPSGQLSACPPPPCSLRTQPHAGGTGTESGLAPQASTWRQAGRAGAGQSAELLLPRARTSE